MDKRILLLEKISSTSKGTEKLSLLRTLQTTDPAWAEQFLSFALDPMKVFFLTVDEGTQVRMNSLASDPEPSEGDCNRYWERFFSVCQNLIHRIVTGHAALLDVDCILQTAPSRQHIIWSCRLLNKDLESGIAASTVNKVFPDLIPIFPVARAKLYDPEKHEFEGRWSWEPKLDGQRLVFWKGQAFTRSGKLYTTVDHMVEALRPLMEDYVLDCEVFGVGGFDQSSGQLRRKNVKDADAVAHFFDCIPRHEWESLKFEKTIEFRRSDLRRNLPDEKFFKIITPVDLVDPSQAELARLRDAELAKGWPYEGGLMKRAGSPYTPDQGPDWFKIKKRDPYDGRIVGTYVHRKDPNMLGGITVDVDGVQSNCGSGFTKQQRLDLWKIRHTLIDKVARMEAQEKTKDGCLRCPTFIDFHPEKN